MMTCLEKIQIWLFEKGANKEFCVWDRLGNLVQDLRERFIA